MSGRSVYYYMKMIEYSNAERILLDKLESINSNLRQCDDSFSNFPRVHMNNINLEGQVIENFNSKSKKFGKELENILNKAKSSRDVISQKQVLAHARYLYYMQLYEASLDDD
ncbi:hypothetical protein HBE96_25045 [Clostridium sp. P21]|uniref:Uncharacterized protein n=1 Tax=Clostridium muellerianum TaxID=2716538 RepID=A0A7Y0HQ90_9CLOT|nr:hypothetical protein [Clostridium muellerianum]NMM65849.1 hypothetical protein [Clostridium muellerianum]